MYTCTCVILLYIDDGSFSNREFSFTLEDDIYVRYQSYETQVALEEGIKNKLPYKIDVGAVFNHKVCRCNYNPWNFGKIGQNLFINVQLRMGFCFLTIKSVFWLL